MRNNTILGLNAYHGDSSAALLVDGRLEAAVEEERFNRVKHWAGLPLEAARACLQGQVPEYAAISRDPRAHPLKKLLRIAARPGEWGRLWSRAENSFSLLRTKQLLQAAGVTGPRTTFHFVEHHRAHLASAFFCSPFEEAAVLSVDGFGDFSSVMWGVGRGNQIRISDAVHYPHSMGLFYTAFTQFLGFPKYGDEYKMMGLAAYGQPRYASLVRDVIRTNKGRVELNLRYFSHHTDGVEMSWEGGEPSLAPVFSGYLPEKFGLARAYRSEIQEQHRDLAASVQLVLEENYFDLLRHVQKTTGLTKVCLAGGVALNCAANGKIFEQTEFKEVYVQPAAHDAGTSLGAALHVQHQVLQRPREFVMRHVYYGPVATESELRQALAAGGIPSEELDEEAVVEATARAIADGQIVGWYQGRSEFGPRALGNRSILADPRRKDMKDILNARIKHREPFRPFCPSVLKEECCRWFENDYESPFMVMAYKIRPERRAQVPAITHADGTGRLQTVERDVNPLYWRLIRRFGALTGVPMLLNTSFNENEPIVNRPEEGLNCFLRTNMDVLVIGRHFLRKTGRGGTGDCRVESGRRAAGIKSGSEIRAGD